MKISFPHITKYVNKKLEDLNLDKEISKSVQGDLSTLKATYFDNLLEQIPFLIVMEYLGLEGIALTSKLLSPSWEVEKADYLRLLENGAFGAKKWKKEFGLDVGEEPPLPKNIFEVLSSICTHGSEQDLMKAQTHMLVLNPARVKKEDGQEMPLGIRFFAEECIGISETILRIHGHKNNSNSTWILMTRGITEQSRRSKNILS